MTIAHISDTHLGFRQFNRVTELGMNQREVDVLSCFRQALDAIAERDPDLVVHSGDLFDKVRPNNFSIISAYGAIARFQEQRRGRPLFLIAGNHETPRTLDVGNILVLFEQIPGVLVVWSADRTRCRRIIPELDLEILGVPTELLESKERESYEPSTRCRHRVLVLHGMERGVIPEASDFDLAETHVKQWSYIALGDFHSFRQFERNCCYAGSTDHVSTNYWDELKEPKCWVWYDTDTESLERVPTNPRKVIDLKPIDGSALTGADITEAMLAQAKWEADEQPIVRQRVFGVRPESRSEIDFSALRVLQERCLHYEHRISTVSASLVAEPANPDQAPVTLDEEWRRHMAEATCPPGIDKDRVIITGERLLEEARDEADFAPA